MVRTTLFRRAVISYWARADAKGQYGKHLLSIGSGKDAYDPSPFMANLAARYEKDCNIVEKREERISQWLKNRVFKEFGEKTDERDKVEREIRTAAEGQREAEDAIKRKTQELNETLSLIRDVSDGIRTGRISDLNETVGRLKSEISQLKQETESFEKTRATLTLRQWDLERDKTLQKLFAQYDDHISACYKEMALIKNKYDDELYLYWRVLMKKLRKEYKNTNKTVLRQKTFSEICDSRNIKIRSKEDIFAEDQTKLRAMISEYYSTSKKTAEQVDDSIEGQE